MNEFPAERSYWALDLQKFAVEPQRPMENLIQYHERYREATADIPSASSVM